jgi:hypothetical protein
LAYPCAKTCRIPDNAKLSNLDLAKMLIYFSLKGRTQPMDTDSTAEIRAWIARRKQLIEISEKLIADSKNLVEQSHRLIRIAMGHDGDGHNQKADDSGSVGTPTFTSFSTSHSHRSNLRRVVLDSVQLKK